MSAPTLRSSSINEGASANNITPDEPAGAASGDILLALVMGQGSSVAITPPSGWSTVGTFHDTASGVDRFASGVYWIRRGGSAPALTFSFDRPLAYIETQVSAWSGCVDAGTPYDVSDVGSVSMADPSAPVCPAITTLTADSTVVLQGISWGGNQAGGFTPPSTFTIINDTSSEGANNATCTAYKTQASPGTVTPGAFGNVNSGNDPCGGITLALVPPASGGGSETGTLDVTESQDSAAVAGAVYRIATLAVTEAQDTAAIAASRVSSITGALAATDQPDVVEIVAVGVVHRPSAQNVRGSSMLWSQQVAIVDAMSELDFVDPQATLEEARARRQPVIYPFNRNGRKGFIAPLDPYA